MAHCAAGAGICHTHGIYQGIHTFRAAAATIVVAGGLLLLSACGGSDDDADPSVLGVTITTTTSTTSTTTTTPATAVPTTAAPAVTTTTTTTPPAPSTGTVEVRYEPLRPNATVTVELENEDGTVAQSADASGTNNVTFTAPPARYRVAITEIGRTEHDDGTATSSAVTSRTELFELAPGGTVVVECAGNADCTIVAS